MSKLHDQSQRHDRFWRRAKRESYAARSVYKLEEIDRRFRVLGPGMRVLDLGCRPGSWLQYAVRAVGSAGAVVGLDRSDLPSPVAGARIVVGDVFSISADTLRDGQPAFDVVLSDMAPDTSGIRSLDQARSESLFARALELAVATLRPGGAFVGKLFQGPGWPALLAEARQHFGEVRTVKPEGSRKESLEQYVVGLGLRTAPRTER